MFISVEGKKDTKKTYMTLLERLTKKYIVIEMKEHTNKCVTEAINTLEEKYGENFKKIFKTMTTDNGHEFLNYDNIERSKKDRRRKRTKVYYTDPVCPYRREILEICRGYDRQHKRYRREEHGHKQRDDNAQALFNDGDLVSPVEARQLQIYADTEKSREQTRKQRNKDDEQDICCFEFERYCARDRGEANARKRHYRRKKSFCDEHLHRGKRSGFQYPDSFALK